MRRLYLPLGTFFFCGALAVLAAILHPIDSHAAAPSRPEGLSSPPPCSSAALAAHFAAANTSGDGHLTQVQAEAIGWTRVSRHFDEIDTSHKGWVSVAEIHAYNRLHHRHPRP